MTRSPRPKSLTWPVPAEEVARVRVVDLQRPLRPQAAALMADAGGGHVRSACVVAVVGAISGFSAVALFLDWLQ